MPITNSKNKIKAILAITLCFVLGVLFLFFKFQQQDPESKQSNVSSLSVSDSDQISLQSQPGNLVPKLPVLPADGVSSDEDWRNAGITKDRVRRIEVELAVISIALDHYKMAFGAYPGGDSLAVMRALSGYNPRKISFIEWRKNSIGSQGELLDPWGMPYTILVQSENGGVIVVSSGPNRVFGDKDDEMYPKPE